jgi:phage terminase large subunit-like protein
MNAAAALDEQALLAELDPAGIALLPRELQERLAMLLSAMQRRSSQRQFETLFPDRDTVGPDGNIIYARDRYPKHMEFIKAGVQYRERAFLAGNRTGKTTVAAFELTAHLTGLYPAWWEGKRFDGPVSAWACGKKNETTRDINQQALLGNVSYETQDGRKGFQGKGLIPAHLMGRITWKRGVDDLVDTLLVKHVSGGWSRVGFKAYEQGRGSFEGTAKHVCLAEGQLVQMADGALRPIEDICPGDVVLSLDRSGQPVPRKVVAVHDNGLRDCIRLVPKQGTSLIVTPDHRVYWGYMPKSNQAAETVEAVAQIMPGTFWPAATHDREEGWYVWAALVVAEGCISQRKITNGDVPTIERAIAMLPEGARVRRQDMPNGHVPDWFLYWPDFWSEMPPGLSHEKRIPSWVFTSSPERVRLFLRWLFMGDGWANHKTIGYATTSEQLANSIVVLLSRMGIRANLSIKRPQRSTWREQFWVTIQRSSEVLRFIDEIGIEGKDQAVAKVHAEASRRLAAKALRGSHFHRDVVKHDRDWIAERGMRARLKASKVSSRQPVGQRRVYDISVEGEHRFLAGVGLVSNCWLDEECPIDIYGECLIRTATTGGIIMLTFTPLEGLTDTVMQFMPGFGD